MRHKRGSVLIMALFVMVMLLVLGMGLLGSNVAKYRAAARSGEAAQAKALALAGLEDARVKIAKDVDFPPSRGEGQAFFAYSEDVFDAAGTMVGSYTVVVDSAFEGAFPPMNAGEDIKVYHGAYRITSTGKSGPRTDTPTAERTLYTEIDMTDFKTIRFEDKGCF